MGSNFDPKRPGDLEKRHGYLEGEVEALRFMLGAVGAVARNR